MTRAPDPAPSRRKRGFEPAGGLLKDRIRTAGEARGFAVSRLLTHWAEVVGTDLAAMTRPVKIGYSKGGFGGTLTLLVQSVQAPMVQMQLPAMVEKVNACYGFRAISRIHLTQTAPLGFAEGQAEFAHAPKETAAPAPDPAIERAAADAALGVRDDGLRDALEALTRNFLIRSKQ